MYKALSPHTDQAVNQEIQNLYRILNELVIGVAPIVERGNQPNWIQAVAGSDNLNAHLEDLLNPHIVTAAQVGYSPDDDTDWVDPDPTIVAGGLDQLADRLTIEEARIYDASEITYSPNDGNDWVAPDPAIVDDALDQLADRLTDHDATHVGAGSDKIRDATAAQDGLMTSVFATKLNGIEAGAKVGDVVGPGSSTDNAIARFNGASGKIIQDYTSGAPVVSDTGQITVSGAVKVYFRDSGIFIHSNADGELTIEADSKVIIGVAGDIELGDGTPRVCKPQTNEKINLGSAANRFNEVHLVSIKPKTVPAYTPTNVTPSRSFDADTVTVAQLADVVGTMISDDQALGIKT